jgi:hypothetical protein
MLQVKWDTKFWSEELMQDCEVCFVPHSPRFTPLKLYGLGNEIIRTIIFLNLYWYWCKLYVRCYYKWQCTDPYVCLNWPLFHIKQGNTLCYKDMWEKILKDNFNNSMGLV